MLVVLVLLVLLWGVYTSEGWGGGWGGGLGGCTPTPAVIDAPRAVADCICKHIQPTDSAFANEALRPARQLCTNSYFSPTHLQMRRCVDAFANALVLRRVCKRRSLFANTSRMQIHTNIYTPAVVGREKERQWARGEHARVLSDAHRP